MATSLRSALFFFLIIAFAVLFVTDSGAATVKPPQNKNILQDTYLQNKVKLETSSFGLPLFLDSYERNERVHVDVYGVFPHPFSSIAGILRVPANWCDIVAIHPNVKACTWDEQSGAGVLNFYVGKKTYQPPEEARQVKFRYQIVSQQKKYQDIILSADEGPFGTKNHIMRFEAIPLNDGRTFVHVSYEYSDSATLRLAGKAYFATFGRSKVGFTITGTDNKDQSLYIGGPRGAIERNAVRYYFAIQSFMNTVRYPENSIFDMRISQWFDLTTRFPKQFSDLERIDYLASKTTEHTNQIKLQGLIGPVLQ